MTPLDALLAASALAALAGAVTRNVTAMALLVSTAVSLKLCERGVPFDLGLWFGMDLAVVFVVMRFAILPQLWKPGGHAKPHDAAVVALYLPVWALYVLQPEWWSQAVILIVCAQMFLTFPFQWIGRFWRKAAEFNRTYDPWDNLDLRTRYGFAR